MINRSQQLSNQLMWNRLLSVVEEQAQTLIRTAFSPIVRECGDISAGIFDLKGRMMAQAVTGTPGHVNSMAESGIHEPLFKLKTLTLVLLGRLRCGPKTDRHWSVDP